MFSTNTQQRSQLDTAPAMSSAVQEPLSTQQDAILWRNSSSGQNGFWTLDGDQKFESSREIPAVADPNWQQKGFGDFNSDGTKDLLWRNSATGEIAIWHLNSDGSIKSSGVLNINPGTSWDTAGVGDFNADGFNDVFFYSTVANAEGVKDTAIWYFNGAERFSPIATEFGATYSGDWVAEGVADFNADGKADVLWQNQGSVDREVVYWQMDGGTRLGFEVLSEYTADSSLSNWEIVGTGDFNQDSKADILWRNKLTNDVASWLMDGTIRLSSTTIAESVEPGWNPVASFAPATVSEQVDQSPRQFLQINAASDLAGQIPSDTRNLIINLASRAELALAGVVSPQTDVIQFNLNAEKVAQIEEAFAFSFA